MPLLTDLSPRCLGGVIVGLLLLALAGCDSGSRAEYTPEYASTPPRVHTTYLFGVHPLHNPTRLHEVFGPLVALLDQRIEDASFRLEASRNYAAYDEKLYARHFHFALPNPYQTVKSLEHGYQVFGKMGNDEDFRGIILVRRDSGIEAPTDLVGKAVSFPAPTALAATMMPQYYLQTHGVDVMDDLDIRYVGSQESSVMNVHLGDVAAGATWPPPWRALAKERPELKQTLRVAWQTEPLPNNGLVVRDDIPKYITEQVAAILFELHTHERGREILARMELSRFEAADDATYAPVREFLGRFADAVRPIE